MVYRCTMAKVITTIRNIATRLTTNTPLTSGQRPLHPLLSNQLAANLQHKIHSRNQQMIRHSSNQQTHKSQLINLNNNPLRSQQMPKLPNSLQLMLQKLMPKLNQLMLRSPLMLKLRRHPLLSSLQLRRSLHTWMSMIMTMFITCSQHHRPSCSDSFPKRFLIAFYAKFAFSTFYFLF